MPRVLVIGATGYLGQPVTQALVRSGLHSVYGVCRSPQKAKSLAAVEVIPIICEDPANNPEKFLDALRKFKIDVVIDCAAAYGDSTKFLHSVKTVGKERIDTFKEEGVALPPKMGFIYISGAWVHGDSKGGVTDLDSVGTASAAARPLDLVAWRPELERQVLASRDVLDVLIFRPAQMHGRSSSGWSAFWGPIAQARAEGKTHLKLPAAPSSRSPVIHVDDVAEAICRGAGRISLFAGTSVYPIFDLVSHTENIREILEAFAESVDIKEEGTGRLELDLIGPGDNAFLKALGSSVECESSRARELLQWEPRRKGLLNAMDMYAAAWKASQ